MSDGFAYVRQRYGVPAKRGMRVRANGKLGTITRSAGHRIRVRLDGEKHSGYWHPTWNMEYEPDEPPADRGGRGGWHDGILDGMVADGLMTEGGTMERYTAGRWDDTNYNVFDREQGNKAVGHPWGYQTLNEAQEAAETMNKAAEQ